MSDFRFTRPESFPPIVKNLIIINVLVYLAQVLLDSQYNITDKIGLIPIIPDQLQRILVQATWIDADRTFQPYQLVTHIFAHSPGNPFHLIFNMFVLWMFGRVLENVWGPKRFLIFYFICGLGAAALHLGMQYYRSEQLLEAFMANDVAGIKKYAGSIAATVGASGAIMGVMAAFAYSFPNTELYLMFLPIPIKAKWAVIGYVAIDLFGGFANSSNDNIAHFAHLGGAITGFIIVLIWNKTNRRTLY